MTPDPIALRLRSIRKAKGLTQRAAEQTADLGTNVIARWERGYGVMLAGARQLANALGYDIVLVKLEGGPIAPTPGAQHTRKRKMSAGHKRAMALGRDDYHTARVNRETCANGHSLTGPKAFYTTKQGWFRCAQCARDRVKRHAARHKVTSAG